MQPAFLLSMALVALAMVLSFAPLDSLWSLSNGADLPLLMKLVWIVCGLAIVPWSYWMERSYARARRRAMTVPDGPTFVTLLLLAAAVLFTVFRSVNHYLGDGWLLLGFVLEDWAPLERRPGWGTIMFHRVIADLLARAGITKPDLPAFQFVSSVAGLVYVLGAHRFASFVATLRGGATARATYWIAFLLIAGAGSMQLYYGYVENYSLTNLFILLFLVEGVRSIHGAGDLRIALLCLVLAGALHLGAIIFWPAVLYLLLHLAGEKRWLKPAMIVLLGLLFVVFPTISELQIHRMFVSWTKIRYHAFGYLWPGHGIFVGNLLLLVLPAAVCFLLFVRRGRPCDSKNEGASASPESEAVRRSADFFLFASTMSALVFSFSMHPYLGPRDWDLFSFFAAPMSLWAGYRVAFARRDFDVARPLAVAAAGVFLSVAWIGGNAREETVPGRVLRLTINDPNHWTDVRRHQGIAVAQVLWEKGHRAEATKLYERAAIFDPSRYRPRMNLGVIYWGENRYEEAKPHLEAAVAQNDAHVPTVYYLGSTYFHLEERDLGERQFRRVLELDPGNPSAASYLGRITMWQGKWEEAKRLLLLAFAATPDDANLNVWLAQTHASLGETNAAIAALERAVALDSSLTRARQELERLRDLREGERK
ncbi:MAG: tetratricopeptide repeat protein [Gemmatimonadetes bacterium]|nr:tetratricopeptide repeat protein [Gemmatimonadota bacterium]